MKRLILLFMLVAVALPLHAIDKSKHKMVSRYNSITKTWATYPEVAIRDIQWVSPDSLAVADAHQVSGDVASNYWTTQVSPLMNDTVVVTALVITPCASIPCGEFGLTFTQRGYTMLIHDTAAIPTGGRNPSSGRDASRHRRGNGG